MKRLILSLMFLACAAPKPYKITNFFINQNAISDIRQQRVAVLEFEDATYKPGETVETYHWRGTRIERPPILKKPGVALADEFSIQLGKLGKFDLVERQRIQELFKEQDIDPKRLDPQTTVKIGRMLGAHGVILGTVRAYEPNKVGLSVRLVSVETGRHVWEAGDNISGNDGRIQVLVDKPDRYRLTHDKDFLSQVLCKLLVETLK